MTMMKKWTGLTGVFLLLAILMVFNSVIRPIRARVDVTEDKLYTLSEGTKELLNELDRDVTLKFYFSKSNDRLPVPMKNFAARVRDLLKEYESRSGGHLVIEEYDPKPDSDEEEWAQRYGLRGQSLNPFGTAGSLYFGIVGISGNHEAAIPMLAQSVEPRLEYLLTQMISGLTKEKAVKVGIMSALAIENEQQSWTIVSELKRLYDVQSIAMTAEEIPEEIDTLVVIHPQGISDASLYALDQFVLRGGRLLAFTDPLSLAANSGMNPRMQQLGIPPTQKQSSLNKLTEAWGITMILGQLAADASAGTLLQTNDGQAERNPAWLSLRQQNCNSEEIATSSLSDIMLPFPGAFEGTVSNGLVRTDLLFTSDDGFTMSPIAAQSGQIEIPADTKRMALAVRLTGTFSTAFPEGKPAEDENAESDDGLKKSEKPGIVILVADTDLIADAFAVQTMNLFGQSIAEPRNDNLSFAANMVEQLCGSEKLIGLRSRTTFDRPFDRVLALEKEATIKWQAKEKELNEKLQATQTRLSALEQTKANGQQLMLSAEQEAEVKKFREEAFQTQQSLKEVRKNLRHDIESLGFRLKGLNIAFIPVMVALFGIGRGLWIRKTH